jgi:hypothetical protein
VNAAPKPGNTEKQMSSGNQSEGSIFCREWPRKEHEWGRDRTGFIRESSWFFCPAEWLKIPPIDKAISGNDGVLIRATLFYHSPQAKSEKLWAPRDKFLFFRPSGRIQPLLQLSFPNHQAGKAHAK